MYMNFIYMSQASTALEQGLHYMQNGQLPQAYVGVSPKKGKPFLELGLLQQLHCKKESYIVNLRPK